MVVTTWHDLIGGREVIRGPVALTIGTFDGVHRGHREIVRRLTECAAGTGRGGPAAPRARAAAHRAVLTFRQHPRSVLTGQHPGTLTTLRQRRERFAALGVTHLVLIDFSVQFSRLSGGEFISALRRAIFLRKLVVGVDFRCGRGRGTDVVELRRLLVPAGVPVVAVPPVTVGGHAVSSTRIRAAVRAGDFAMAEEMMGSPFEVDLRGAVETRRAATCGAERAFADSSYVAAGQLEQILPQPGTYAASLAGAGGNAVAAVVEVAPDGLRWAWPAAMRRAPLALRFHRRVDPRREERPNPTGDVTIASRVQEK